MAEPVITTTLVAGGIILAASGELDYVGRAQFAERLSHARQASDVLILDMAGVDFLDTSCLAAIVECWQEHAKTGGRVVLAGARYEYTRALWITGLAGKLPMYDDVEAALTAVRG